MKDPLGVRPRKGNQGTTRGKEKVLLTICVHSATRHNIHMYPVFPEIASQLNQALKLYGACLLSDHSLLVTIYGYLGFKGSRGRKTVRAESTRYAGIISTRLHVSFIWSGYRMLCVPSKTFAESLYGTNNWNAILPST